MRRLAAHLLAERPDLAGDAAALLPAAGYEAPPADAPRRSRHHFADREGISPEVLAPYIASVRQDIAAGIVKHGSDARGSQIFARPNEAAIWDSSMLPADCEELIAILRLFDDLGESRGEDNGEDRHAVLSLSQLAASAIAWHSGHKSPEKCWNHCLFRITQ